MENENIETVETGADNQPKATYTEEEVAALVQREADKRVSQALKTQQAKFEKKMSEAEKLRDMDAEQRKTYEFEQRMAEFEEQKKEFTLTQNKLEASKVMSERGLPISFVEYVVSTDAETMLDNINNFEKQWKAAVTDAVNQKIAAVTGTPKASAVSQTGLTKEEFNKMNISQQAEIFRTNPELYKQLTAH